MHAERGLAGWVGAATSIRSPSMHARRGDVAGAERALAEVRPQWRAWWAWDIAPPRAAVAARSGDAGAPGRRPSARPPTLGDGPRWFDRVRCAALAAPTLVRAGQPGRARAVVESDAGRSGPRASPPRACARSCLAAARRRRRGRLGAPRSAAAWAQAGDQARHLVRREWPRLERPLWAALEHEAVDPVAAIGAVAEALPGGAALGALHPPSRARRAPGRAAGSAVAAGHPEGVERLADFERDPDPEVAAAARAAAERLRSRPAAAGLPPLRRVRAAPRRRGWSRRPHGSAASPSGSSACCSAAAPAGDRGRADRGVLARQARRRAAAAASRSRCRRPAACLDPPGAESSRLVAGDRTYRLSLGPGDTVDAARVRARGRGGAGRDGRGSAAPRWSRPRPMGRRAAAGGALRGLGGRLARAPDRPLRRGARGAERASTPPPATTSPPPTSARRFVELDPVNEAAHRQLIVAYARAGQRGHALRQFLACRQRAGGRAGRRARRRDRRAAAPRARRRSRVSGM